MRLNYYLFHAKSETGETRAGKFIPCIDGLFSAAVIAHAFDITSKSIEVIPCNYNAPPELEIIPGATKITLLDLSYPALVLKGWQDKGADVCVIDHHAPAMKQLSEARSILDVTKFDSVFNAGMSGATLTWKCFFTGPTPKLLKYVQDYDIWTKKLSQVDEVHFGLLKELRDLSFEEALEKAVNWLEDSVEEMEMDSFIDYQIIYLAEVGKASAAWQAIIDASNRCKSKRDWRLVAGELVPFVSLKTKEEKEGYSMIGHELLKRFPEAPFACVETGGGWALRSQDHRMDVSKVAKSLGGGGHRNAARCRSDRMV